MPPRLNRGDEMRFVTISLLVLCLSLGAGPAIAQHPDDHPLVSSYPGSELQRKDVEDFARFPLITGVVGNDEFTAETIEGTLTRLTFSSPRDRSSEEIFQNYAQALTAAGLSELFRCAGEECGPAFASSRWNRFNQTINLGGRDARYLAGSMQTAGGLAYVAIAVSARDNQITVLEVQSMEAGLIKIDPDALGDELDLYGHVAIPGVFFETGSAALTAESAEALAAMQQILDARPQINVWVVGHTDWTGSFELNMGLSDARAKSVVAALVEDYGIAATRLIGHGVGPLSPSAGNGSDTGRTANRRVELVVRPD